MVSTMAFGQRPLLAPMNVKQSVEAKGIGKRVKLKETNGTTLHGKIVSIGEESCVVQRGSHQTVTVPYSDLADVRGAGLSKGAKIGIGVGIGVVVTVVVVAVIAEHNLKGLGNLKVPLY